MTSKTSQFILVCCALWFINQTGVAEVNYGIDDSVIYLPEYAKLHYVAPAHFRRPVTVLFWSPVYGHVTHWAWWFNNDTVKDTCPELPCEFTIDKTRLNKSDAVVFSVYGYDTQLNIPNIMQQFPPYRLPNQRWVFYSSESPRLSSERIQSLKRINGIFNWTMTYRRDSDIWAHYGRLVLTKNQSKALDIDYSVGKTKMAAWFVGHCVTTGRREDYISELQRYNITVDIYGGCGTLKCGPPRSWKCYEEAARQYKFYLSFENMLCLDYVTEKFTRVLATNIVPVVFGGADYSHYGPPGSYINALQFDSPKALAEYLIYLDKNPKEYNRYFDWKRGYDVTFYRSEMYACELCLKLMDPNSPPKTYHDIRNWWHEMANCGGWQPDGNVTTVKPSSKSRNKH